MQKIDFKTTLKHLYAPSAKEVVELDVPEMNFLMIDGKGDPNVSQEFKEAIETLYPVAFALKFMAKKADAGNDFVVPPLEGLWWADDMNDFASMNKTNWKWTLMIMQPGFVTGKMVDEVVVQVKEKKDPPLLSRLRFASYHEGLSAQILHLGPFSEEGPTIERLHDFITKRGRQNHGKHHEIYLSDFRKVSPEKMRTVLRQPMR